MHEHISRMGLKCIFGCLFFYYVYLRESAKSAKVQFLALVSGNSMVEHTTDLTAIISGLAAGTAYEIQVCE